VRIRVLLAADPETLRLAEFLRCEPRRTKRLSDHFRTAFIETIPIVLKFYLAIDNYLGNLKLECGREKPAISNVISQIIVKYNL
jgi:hypothetical protein